jgi:hypothetical protein
MISTPPTQQRVAELSRLLRAVGALVVLAAASTFLLQRWSTSDDLQRAWTLLAHTALLAVAGFACGLAIREEKGARTFLGLAVAMVPVHFTVLGALVYSVFGEPIGGLPESMFWYAPSPRSLALTLAGNLAVLMPIAAVSLLALARPAASRTLPVLLLGHAVLLAPTRDPDQLGALVLAVSALLAWFEVRVVPRHVSLCTPEGRYVRLLLWAPVALLVARNFHLHDISWFLSGSTLLAAGLAAWIGSRRTSGSVRAALELVTLGALGMACACHALALALPPAAFLPLVALSFAPAAAALSMLVEELDATYRRVAAGAAILGVGFNMLIYPGPVTSWLCVATSVAVLAYAWFVQQRMILLAGVLGLLLGLSQQLHYAVELFQRSQWLALAVLGSVTILGASLLERHHEKLGTDLRALRAELSRWES